MAFSSKDLSRSAKTLGAAILTTAFMISNANAGTGEELTCYTKEADIKATQARLLEKEHMIPVTSHFTNVGTDKAPKWGMATLMMNPQTKKGYQWARMPEGYVCISKSYSNVELYANVRLDPKAFLDTKVAPRADDVGNGKDFSTNGVNAVLLVSQKENQFPMYRATVDDIINLTKAPLKTPTKYVEYLVGNPSTKEGTILAANFNGKMIGEYYGVVGTPQKDGVKFGAIFSPAGEQLVGLTSSVAPK